MSEKTTALAPIQDREQVALALADLQHEIDLADTTATQAAIIRKIMSAGSVEEALADTTVVSMSDAVGRAFLVRSATVMPSAYGSGKGAYLSCDAVDTDTGEEVVLNCSGKVAGRIWIIQYHGGLPMTFLVKTLKGGEPGKGNPCDIERVK